MNIRHLVLLCSLLLLSACGSGGGSGDDGSGSSVSGGASKGPISGATIIAYTVGGDELGRTVTNSEGLYTLTLSKNYNGIVVIESSGGSYTDEATAAPGIPAPKLTAATQLKGESEIVLSITPLTDLAYKLADQDSDVTDVDDFNSIVAREFGLGDIDITSVIPKDLVKLSATNDSESYYGTVLATLSQLQKDDVSMSGPMDVIDAFKVDLEANGKLQASKALLVSAIDNANSNSNIKTNSTVSNNIKSGLGKNLIPVASVTVDATVVLAVGATKQLMATVFPSNADNKAVMWDSSNKSIAVVGSNGVVTAVSAGTATVTVTTANNKKAQSVITVQANNADIVAPTIKATHANISILNTEVVQGSVADFSALFSDSVTSTANLEYKIANYTSIPSGFGVSIGLGGASSANYAKTRPSGNKIYVAPVAGFSGTTIVELKARDEAGNESVGMQFTLLIRKSVVVTPADKKPILQNQVDTLVIQNQVFSNILLSSSGGGGITDCTSNVPLAAGLTLTVSADKQSCQISGKSTNTFDTTYTITAKNAKGDSSATITIISQQTTGDADSDGLTNGQELANNLNPLNGADADANNDGDGLTNKEEIRLGLDLNNADDDVGNRTDADKLVYRVANRLTYGAHSSLIQDIKAQGVDAWINAQLDTPNTTLTADISQVKRDSVRMRNTNDLTGSNNVAAARAVHSNYPLQTVMGDFWDNHFSTLFVAGGLGPHELNDQDYFYLNSLGNFGELLEYSAKSRSMSQYLNGNRNSRDKANENYAREVMELHTLGIHPNGFQAYDANTIKAAAKIFTGWRYTDSGTVSRYQWYETNDYRTPSASPTLYPIETFTFNAGVHNDGLKDYDKDGFIDGDKTFPLKDLAGNPVNYTVVSRAGAGGVLEGEEFLKILADHPATAKYVCIKLARKFVSDSPTDVTVSACLQTFIQFKDSSDQIVQVLKTLFSSSEFSQPSSFFNKIKDDQEYVLSLYRLLELDATDGNTGKGTSRTRTAGEQLIRRSGQAYFNHGPPTGYGETHEHWNDTMVQYNRTLASNTIISSSWSPMLVDYFNTKGITDAAGVIRYIVPLMTAGNYDQKHLKMAHDILYKNDSQFNMQEDRLRVLLSVFAQLPTYHLQ